MFESVNSNDFTPTRINTPKYMYEPILGRILMAISVPPIGDDNRRTGAYFTPLAVSSQASPNMTVQINPGSFYTANAVYKEYAGGNSPTISAPTSNAKWVVIVLNESALISVLNGAASSNPVLPTIPEDVLPLAGIFVSDTTTSITSDMVFDLRPLWSIRPENVDDLAGELADRPTTSDVTTLLALKADLDGTTDSTFTLNKDLVGVPGANALLEVERGSSSNVGIRWNETFTGSPATGSPAIQGRWEFTNDGVTYDAIGASSGTFYTQAVLNGGVLDFRYYTKAQLDGTGSPATPGTGSLDIRYYVKSEVDTLLAAKAALAHTHVVADITDFSSGVSTFAPVKSVAGKTGFVTLVQADIADLDTYDKVFVGSPLSDPPPGNFVTFGAANTLADAGFGAAAFAGAAHTHVEADITDLGSYLSDITSESIDDLVDVTAFVAPKEGHVLAYQVSSTDYVNRYLSLDDLAGVQLDGSPPSSVGDVIIHDGSKYTNRNLIFADISDISIGDLVTTNASSPMTSQTIFGEIFFDGSVSTSDGVIELNTGEVGPGVDGGTGNAGLTVKRGSGGSPFGPLPDAVFQWDEGTGVWLVGTVGSVAPVLTTAHTHVAADITNFSTAVTTELAGNDLDSLADVTYVPAPTPGQVLQYSSGVGSPLSAATWVPSTLTVSDISNFAAGVTTELGNNDLRDIGNVDSGAVVAGDIVIYDGGSPVTWSTRAPLKADISNFVEGDYVHTYASAGSPLPSETIFGDKTFSQDVTISGNLTVDGTTTALNTATLTVEDNIVLLNSGEAGAGVDGGTGSSGIRVDRGSLPDALLVWDEPNGRWEAGNLGSPGGLFAISLSGHSHTKADITDFVESDYVHTAGGAGAVMAAAADITFVGGGEVLGLPATPSATGAASKEYVDSVAASQNELRELDDVTIVAPVAGHFIAYDGSSPDSWVNRVIVEADISDLQNYLLPSNVVGAGSPIQIQAWDANLDTIAALTPAPSEVLVGQSGSPTDWTSRLLDFSDLSDVTTTAAVLGDFLQKTAGDWVNIAPASITEFVHATGAVTESIDGDKTFTGDVTFQGTTTTIDTTNLTVEDNNILLNKGYVGLPAGSTGSGLSVERGTAGSPPVYGSLIWDETDQNWHGGLSGSEVELAQVGVDVAQPYYHLEVVGASPAVTFDAPFGVPTPAAGQVGIQVFVNGIKQREGGVKQYTVLQHTPVVRISFNAGAEPPLGADLEIYGFGTIG